MYKIIMKPISDNGLPNIDVKCHESGNTLLFEDVIQANNWIHKNVDSYRTCLYTYVVIKLKEGE